MSGTTDRSGEDGECGLGFLLGEIDRALETNMTCSPKILAEVDEIRAKVERLCAAGDTEQARGLTGIAVSRLRTGEPSKE